jgi:hypothetical protein
VGTVTGGTNVAALFDGSAAMLPDEHVTLVTDITAPADEVAALEGTGTVVKTA